MFSDLPREIQREIFLVNPETLSNTFRLNRNIYDTMNPDYLDYVCNKPITPQELIGYANSYPNKLGLIKRQNDFVNEYLFYVLSLDKNRADYSAIYQEVTDNKRYVMINTSVYDSRRHKIYGDKLLNGGSRDEDITKLEPDLLTISQILKRRCPDNKHIKNTVLKILDQKYQNSQPGAHNTLSLYVYLMCNYSLITDEPMVLYQYPDDLAITSDKDPEYIEIRQSLPMLYEKLKLALLNYL